MEKTCVQEQSKKGNAFLTFIKLLFVWLVVCFAFCYSYFIQGDRTINTKSTPDTLEAFFEKAKKENNYEAVMDGTVGGIINIVTTVKNDGKKAEISIGDTNWIQKISGNKIYRYVMDKNGNWSKTEITEATEYSSLFDTNPLLNDFSIYEEIEGNPNQYKLKQGVQISTDDNIDLNSVLLTYENGVCTITYSSILNEDLELTATYKLTISNVGKVNVTIPNIK